MRISKTKFMAGRQCLKRLYFQVRQPELAAEPDAASEAVIEQGREVGLLARQMFAAWELLRRGLNFLLRGPAVSGAFRANCPS
ncbi:MAG: hypothetical protein WBQ89_27585 [Candidatus Acidiferrum sp.]